VLEGDLIVGWAGLRLLFIFIQIMKIRLSAILYCGLINKLLKIKPTATEQNHRDAEAQR